MNAWEKNTRSQHYLVCRDDTEKGVFNYLPADLKSLFIQNTLSRPRYGALSLLNKDLAPAATGNYGRSFLVLKDIVKLNAIFLPGDSLNYSKANGKNYIPCTFHHLELLLWKCSLNTLNALITCIQTGSFPTSYSFDYWTNANSGYLEVMIPALNIFDRNMVEYIYINPADYQIDNSILSQVSQIGIDVDNNHCISYKHLKDAYLLAIRQDNVPLLNQLLSKHSALIKIFDPQGNLHVHIASMHNSLQILKYFFDKKISFSTLNVHKHSLLVSAAEFSNLEILQFILDALRKQTNKSSREILLEKDGYHRSLLHYASKNKNSDIAAFLIKNHLEINDFDDQKWTPLHFATFHMNNSVVDLLFKAGANPLLTNNADKRSDQLINTNIVNFENFVITKLKFLYSLLKNPDGMMEFNFSLENWINMPFHNNNTMLHYALINKDFAVVNNILTIYKTASHFNALSIANLNLALSFAIRYDKEKIVKSLLKFPFVDVHYRFNNQSALDLAVKLGKLSFVKLMLSSETFLNTSYDHIEQIKQAHQSARKFNHDDIACEIAKRYLFLYLKRTSERPSNDYSTKITFWGKTWLKCGYPAGLKYESGLKYLSFYEGKTDKTSLIPYRKILKNGELGKITTSLKLKF